MPSVSAKRLKILEENNKKFLIAKKKNNKRQIKFKGKNK